MISPLNTAQLSDSAALFPRSGAQGMSDFAGVLEMARESDAAAKEKAQTVGNQLVATAMIQPILAELRNSPFKSDLFDGGRAEEVFGQQLDTTLADRIASSPAFSSGLGLAGRLTNTTSGLKGQVDTVG